MTPPPPPKRYRCRSCGGEFPAWLPVMQAPDGPMLLHHLSAGHPAEVGPYLARLRTEDIATVAAEAFEDHMEIARIVLEYVKALAWPSVVVVALLLFRRQLRGLVETLQHLKLPGGAEMDWQRQIDATEQAAERVEAEQPPQLPHRGHRGIVQQIYDHGLIKSSSDYNFSYYGKMVETDPNLALAGVRIELESKARQNYRYSSAE